MKLRLLPVLLAFTLADLGFGAPPTSLVYVGTYTDRTLLVPRRENAAGERSEGIYVFRFDTDRGTLTSLGLAAASPNPTYVTLGPSHRVLYATNEIYQFRGEAAGAVSAFAIDTATGKLSLLNQESAHGPGTCHANVDPTGKLLLAANFGGGSVAAFPLNTDGSLRPASAFVQDTGSGPSPRQATPHAHSFNFSPDGRLAVAAEFGTDKLMLYRPDLAAGTLTPAEPPFVAMAPGSAPRHLAFHPRGAFTYSVNEIDSTVTALACDANHGSLKILQTLSTLPADFKAANTAAEVVVHPSGKFLYASNRGHHSLAVFAIGEDGRLTVLAHVSSGGRTPRGFSVDPSGRWLIAANQDTHNLAVFAIDARTGIPSLTSETSTVHTPVCVKFLAVEN